MYDAIVVGASFSGLMTAINTTKTSKVLVIEKRKEPGTPINTTGAVPIEWLTKMGVFPDSSCISGNLRGIQLVAPNGESFLVKNPKPDGMVLYPDKYVKWLAARAADRGVEILTDTVFNRIEDGATHGGEGGLTVVTSRGNFKGKFIVGADGAASNVGRAVGLGERPKPEDLHIGIEYTIENNHIQDPEVFALYLGHNVAPLGYAWSFPEGPDRLKIGLGIPQSLDLTPKDLMVNFVKKYPEFRKPISKRNGGIIPTAPPLKTAVKGNVMLVGDAAHFCSPLHGGGIWFGMQSGQFAGMAISRGNPQLYERLWKRELGGVLRRHYKLKQVIYKMSDKDFDDLVALMNKALRLQGTDIQFSSVFMQLFFSNPGFILAMAGKWSTSGLAIDFFRRMLIPSFRIA